MRNFAIGFALSFAAVLLSAQAPQRGPQPRPQIDPSTLPAKDSHQGLLIALKPDITAESSKAVFGKHTPYDAGILGVDVYFKNDSDAPIHIDLHTVRLFVGDGEQRQKLGQLAPDQVADLVLMIAQRDPTSTRRTPLPRATLKSKGKDWNELDAVLRSSAMSRDVLPSHSTTHGYFFFDIGNQFDALANSRFDIPDLLFTPTGEALFFFQIDLAPALKH
jgi:hypothetical protein